MNLTGNLQLPRPSETPERLNGGRSPCKAEIYSRKITARSQDTRRSVLSRDPGPREGERAGRVTKKFSSSASSHHTKRHGYINMTEVATNPVEGTLSWSRGDEIPSFGVQLVSR